MRILVAEDDVRLAALLEESLTEVGWATDVVHDGRSAFDQLLSDLDYDVLLLDWMLPGAHRPWRRSRPDQRAGRRGRRLPAQTLRPRRAARHSDQRFTRADEARPRPGSGLGLALVEVVVAQAGGELRLRHADPHVSQGPPAPVPCGHGAAMTVTALLPEPRDPVPSAAPPA